MNDIGDPWLEECFAKKRKENDVELPICDECKKNNIAILFGHPVVINGKKLCVDCRVKRDRWK